MPRHYPILTVLTFFGIASATKIPAQCPITVDAGPDRYVCNIGEQTTLLGSVSGNYLDVLWSPPTGLSNPTILTPNATVTGPMTYTLSASAYDPTAPNLVTNPAFEAGNTGFTSDYTYTSSPITPGTYYITNSPSIVIANFPPCDDHTYGNGTGNMLLVNGAGVPGANIWCQTIPVTPNTTYFMSAWVTSSPIDPAVLQFYVNGSPVGNAFTSSGGGCYWEQFSASWNSANAATANVCIVTQNSGNGLFGDDYALDDIYFGAACTQSDMVNVDVANVDAQAPAVAFLLCSSLPGGIQLDGSASSSGPYITYQWATSGGNIVSGANSAIATVNAEGTYTLTVTYDDGSVVCQDVATVVVLPDPNLVFANATAPPPALVNCAHPTLTLDGTGSSVGADIAYSWTPSAGIVSGGNTLHPVVGQGGTYTLTVTNLTSGCTATASAVVQENFDTPVAAAAANDTITCANSTVTLDGSGSTTGPNISYQWETTFGHIVSGSNTLNNCLVDSAGVYQLTVSNTASQCTAVALAVVLSDLEAPQANGGPDMSIACGQTSATLNGGASSSGPGFTHLWTTADGHIVAGANTTTPTVDSAGTYVLTVTNELNACTATDTVLVTAGANALQVAIDTPAHFDCLHDTLMLMPQGDSLPVNVVPVWSTADGHIAEGDSSISVTITAPGTYYLHVLDTLHGCIGLDSVVVGLDTLPPQINILQTDTLTCNETVITLPVMWQPPAPDTFQWTAIDGGHLVSANPDGSAVVDAGGLYVFTAMFLSNGCTSSDTVLVVNLQDSIHIAFETPLPITCLRDTAQLDATPTNPAPHYAIEWSTSNGQLLYGENTLTPVAASGGDYYLTIYDSLGHCLGTDTLTVVYDTTHPVVLYAADGLLTCADTVFFPQYEVDFVDIPAALQALSFEVVSGHVWAGSTSDSTGFDAGGIYVLHAFNSESGCADSDTFFIAVDSLPPAISFATPPVFLCSSDSIQLSASANTSASFSWSTQDGLLLSGPNTDMPWVGAPGQYLATATSYANGCSTTDTLSVPADSNAPTINVASATLTCQHPQQQLTADINGVGPFDIAWSTTNGQINGSASGPQILVSQAGTYTIAVTDLSNGCFASQNVDVGVDTLAPQLIIFPVPPLNCVTDTVALTVIPKSGSNLEWQWSTSDGNFVGIQDSKAWVNAAGIYQVMVTDVANGCSTEALISVDQDTTAPKPDIAWFESLNCQTPNIQLFGSALGMGPFSWQWTTSDGLIAAGEDQQNVTIAAAGTYQLMVTDLANGCSASTSEYIPVDTLAPQLNLTTNGILTCNNPSVIITASVSGMGPFSWQWTTPDGHIAAGEATPVALVDAAGTYQLLVTDLFNGCTAVASQQVGADTTAPVVQIATSGSITCATTQVTLTASASGTGPFSWHWSTTDGHIAAGEATPVAVVDAAGTYQLLVTDLFNGCTAVASQQVGTDTTAPVVQIVTSGSITCATTQATLMASASGTGPFSWHWSTADGHIAAGEATPVAVVDAAGTYQVVLTDSANGCVAATAATVLADTLPPHVSAGPDVFLTCSETITALTGISQNVGVLYQWTTTDGHIVFGATTTMPAVDQPGTYTLTVTNPANGCTASDQAQALTIVMEAFEVSKENADCASGFGSISFGNIAGGSPPFEYSVDGGSSWSSQPVFDSLPPADYTVVVKDAQGCRLDSNLSILAPPVIVAVLEPEHLIRLGESVQLVPQLSFSEGSIAEVSWSPPTGLSCTDCLAPMAGPTVDTDYLLHIADTAGCETEAQTRVVVDRRPAVFVPNAFSPNDDGINDELLLFGRPGLVKRVKSFLVFDRWGGLVFENYNFPSATPGYGWDGRKDGRLMPPGVYVWMSEVLLVDDSTLLLKGEVTLVK